MLREFMRLFGGKSSAFKVDARLLEPAGKNQID
jgi:hypothetical protein